MVELIIAISIAAIVAASVSALIAYSIRMYHNEKVNTEMQYELQTNVNQVMDSIMSSSGVVVVQGSDKTEYAGFGKFVETRDADEAVTSVAFSGVILASGEKGSDGLFEIYLRRVPETSPVTGDTAAKAVEEASKVIKDATDKKPYLLGQNAKVFNITVDTDITTSSCIVSATEYINPLAVNVELEFEKDGTGRVINKRVKDVAVIRNKVISDIWINGSKYVQKK